MIRLVGRGGGTILFRCGGRRCRIFGWYATHDDVRSMYIYLYICMFQCIECSDSFVKWTMFVLLMVYFIFDLRYLYESYIVNYNVLMLLPIVSNNIINVSVKEGDSRTNEMK